MPNPDVTFFTGLDALSPQPGTAAFGPVSGQDSTHYRVCSWHSGPASPPAYAVCDGLLLAQRLDNDQLNLILKPVRQQFGQLPPIAYFIYRGVRRDSLLSADDIAASDTNDLTKAIWEAHELLKKSIEEATGTAPASIPNAAILGIGPLDSMPAETALDKIFAHPPEGVNLPLVRSGWHIGALNSAGFGFEIVFDSVQHQPTLGHTRSQDAVLEFTPLTAAAAPAEQFSHWYNKQQLFTFLDPCAFYYSLAQTGVTILKNVDRELYAQEELIDQLGDLFHNRHICTLDIRDQQQNTLLLSGDYGSTIPIDSGGGDQPFDYLDTGWPLIRLAEDDFAGLGPSDSYVQLNIRLPRGEDLYPVAFLEYGASPESFPQPAQGISKFVRLTAVDSDDFSTPLPVQIPVYQGAPVCSYIRLAVGRGFDWANYPRPPHDLVIYNNHVLDNLFLPFLMVTDLDRPQTRVFQQLRYVDDAHTLSCDMAVCMGVAIDETHITFFAFPSIRNVDLGLEPGRLPLTDKADPAALFLTQVLPGWLSPQLTRGEKTLADGSTITYLNLVQLEDDSFLSPDWSDFFALTLSRDEFSQMENLAGNSDFLAGCPIYLGLDPDGEITDADGQSIQVWKIVLRGYERSNDIVKIRTLPVGKNIHFIT